MGYQDVAAFYEEAQSYGAVEKLLMYGALGGTPRYHGEADPRLPWDEQIVDLLLRPGAPFENEVRSLLASEQVRDPAPYNAILAAIAAGRTRHSQIQNATGLAATAITHPLNTLIDLEWVRKERSFGETSDRRSIYCLADPFLQFWYRFGVPLASALRFEDPMDVFRKNVEPRLDDYMGWSVFEEVCAQWLRRRGRVELGIHVREVSRYWSRDGNLEIDQVAQLGDGGYLFGECKWSSRSIVGSGVYARLRAKVDRLPNPAWQQDARYALYSVGGFTDELRSLAASEGNLHLVDGDRLF
jgi:AAA+ ATPase superfamily predicted ATPase